MKSATFVRVFEVILKADHKIISYPVNGDTCNFVILYKNATLQRFFISTELQYETSFLKKSP
jgi:hypothetical protein